MQRTFFAALICLSFAGCSVDELVLSPSEAEVIGDNVEGAIDAYQSMTDYGVSVGLGETDLTDAQYTAPDASNEWMGRLEYTGDIDGHNGTVVLDFHAEADGQPVDPFLIDASSVDSVLLTGTATFNGTSVDGAPLSMSATFSFDVSADNGQLVQVSVAGNFSVNYDDHVVDLATNGFTVDYDGEREIVNVAGRIDGEVDVPNLVYDADVTARGEGDQLAYSVGVLGIEIDRTIAVSDF
ncbi:MAG: hypothetical protein ACYTGN_01235 [Planctomycetota bacterium]|jgi:hypothetical protein